MTDFNKDNFVTPGAYQIRTASTSTLAAFPLHFKLCKLTLQIKNTANGNVNLSRNLYVSQTLFYARISFFFFFFRQSEKGIYCKTAMDFIFIFLCFHSFAQFYTVSLLYATIDHQK